MINPLRWLRAATTRHTPPASPAAPPRPRLPIRPVPSNQAMDEAAAILRQTQAFHEAAPPLHAHSPLRPSWVDYEPRPKLGPQSVVDVPAAIECGPAEMVRRINDVLGEYQAVTQAADASSGSNGGAE